MIIWCYSGNSVSLRPKTKLTMTTITTEFNYEAFDRQMETLLQMSMVLITGWDDYAAQELTFDIRSLCVKGSRLCSLADQDLALQQADLTHVRRQANQYFYVQLNELVTKHLSPLMSQVVDDIRNKKTLDRPSSSAYQQEMSDLLPRLGQWLASDDSGKERFTQMVSDFTMVEKQLAKTVKPTHYPGVPWKERFLNLLRYYALMCCLLYHFQQVMELSGLEVKPDEAGRMFTRSVQEYLETAQGEEELKRYHAMLRFKNNGEPLDDEQLEEAQHKLVEEVPSSLQTCFMEHIYDMDALAMDILEMNPQPSSEDFQTFLGVVARWQWLSERRFECQHPEHITPTIYNKVFHTSVNGKPVDFQNLRSTIKRMMKYIDKKNHWFCLYSVLKFRNLIKDTTATYFVEQMMHHDWFPDLPEYQRFNGDTLSEYNGYLNDTRFPAWNEASFENYRIRHRKKKWSPELWLKFKRRCEMMDAVFSA